MNAFWDSKILVSLTGENGVGSELQCPLCKNVILDAQCSMKCLHRYCRECIEEWIDAQQRAKVACPVCHTPFHHCWDLKSDKRFDAISKLWHKAIPIGDGMAGVKTRQAITQRRRQRDENRDRSSLKRTIDRETKRCMDPLPPKPHASTAAPMKRDRSPLSKRQRQGAQMKKDIKEEFPHDGYGTSMHVVLKPLDETTGYESLYHKLQKDTQFNTLRELIRDHVCKVRADDVFRKCAITFYFNKDGRLEMLRDCNNKIGIMQKRVVGQGDGKEMALYFECFLRSGDF